MYDGKYHDGRETERERLTDKETYNCRLIIEWQ